MADELWKLDKQAAREEWIVSTLERQASVVEALAAQARGESADAACRGWVGLQRQAARYRRSVESRLQAIRIRERWAGEVAAHRRRLDSYTEEADAALSAVAPAAVAAARRQLGVRVVILGKGGAGKSMCSATLARLLARRGRRVLAADLDTNPGLAYSTGVDPHAGALSFDVVEAHDGAAYGWRLREGVTPTDVVERDAVVGPDDVRFLSLGKIDTVDKRASRRTVVAMLEVLQGFGEPSWDVIGDLEAGPTTPFERYHAFADSALVIVGPGWSSAMTARRLLPVVDDLPTRIVANRFGQEPDHPGLTSIVRIPADPCVVEAERRGLAPLDHCPDSPAVRALQTLADMLVDGT